ALHRPRRRRRPAPRGCRRCGPPLRRGGLSASHDECHWLHGVGPLACPSCPTEVTPMKLHASLFAALSLFSPLALIAAPADLSLDEVLARHYEARGGLDAIKAVKSYRSTGDFTMGPMQAPYAI